MDDESRAEDRLVESAPVRSPRFDEGPSSVLTPMGQVDSVGAFARGLGARRLKLALGVGGGVVLLVAVLAAVG
jgi:hypothetical protein